MFSANQVVLPYSRERGWLTHPIDGHPEAMAPGDRSVIDRDGHVSAAEGIGRRLEVDVVVGIVPGATGLIHIDSPQTRVAGRGAETRIASVWIRHVDLIDEGVGDVPVHGGRRAPVAHGTVMRGVVRVVPQD